MSVRARLTIWYSSSLTLVLVCFALAVIVLLQYRLYGGLDAKLAEDREVAEQFLDRDAEGRVVLRVEDYGEENPLGFEVVAHAIDGQVLATFPKEPPPRWLSAVSATTRGVRTIDQGAVALRVLSSEEHAGSTPVVIHVARAETELRGQLHEIVLVLLLLLPVSLALAAGGGFLLARKAMRPIEQMGTQAAKISAERLGERMPIDNPDDEFGQLGRAFNDTLDRLERAFVQLRQFTADASHELRTPLTALRSVGEVGLRNDHGAVELREVIGSMLEEADRMTRLVDTLLLLARSDAGALPLARSTVSLSELAREVVGTLAVLAEEKHLNVEVVGEDARVPGDRTLLRQVFVNLVHNAIRHSPRDATITVAIATADGVAECCVSDAGPGIAPEHRAHVFQRFYRADAARSQAAGGAGLGLALVRSIVELHGGTVVLVDRDGPGAVFCVRLPAEGAQPATASARPRPSP